MAIGVQLSLGGQPSQRLLFEHCRIGREIFENPRLQNKKAAVDPAAVAGRFLLEMHDLLLILGEYQRAKPVPAVAPPLW